MGHGLRGPDAGAFVNYVITRDAAAIEPMRGKFYDLSNPAGSIVNDPVELRPAEDEFWFSASDSDQCSGSRLGPALLRPDGGATAQPVGAEVAEVPFHSSEHPSARERHG